MDTFIDPASILPWGQEHTVTLKDGRKKIVRSCDPTDHFWSLWRTNREQIKASGVSVFQRKDETWKCYWWLRDHVEPVPVKSSLPEFIKGKLRDYQIPVVEACVAGLKTHGYFLNACGLGSGKSYQSLATALVLNKKCLVLSRKAAMPAWRSVAKHFGMAQSDLTVINIEAIRPGNSSFGSWKRKEFTWVLPKNYLVIWDEVHNASAMNSKNSEMLMALRRQGIPVIALSATAANSPLKMKALGYILKLHEELDFYPWMYRHGCEKGRFGMEFNCGLSWNILRTPDGQKLLRDNQNQMMLRIHNEIFKAGKGYFLSTDDIPGFPEKQIIPVAVDFGHQAEIDKIYKEMAWELADLKLTKGKDRSILSIQTEARRKTELLKIPGMVEEALEALEEGMSVPIFVNYDASVQALCDKLSTNCRIVGWQTDDERQQCLEDFQSNKSKLIIVNTAAGGESIGLHDLHGGHPRLSLLNPSWHGETCIQACARTARDGAKSKSIIKILIAAGTIEEQILENLNWKSGRINTMNSGGIIGLRL
jgi:hypothetical protein